MEAHIIDMDILLKINSKPWVIDKNHPNTALLKINLSDFNLIKSGIYKNQNNKIEFNNHTFYLPNKLFNEIKIICKNKKITIDNIVISMQEYLNKDIIDDIEYTIDLNNILKLKGDIYLICSINTERNFKNLFDKVLQELKKENINIKKIYYLNNSILNNKDNSFKICLVCLNHLIGYEIKNNVFTDNVIEKYNKVFYYDNNSKTLDIAKNINSFLNLILSKTDQGLREVIKEDIKDDKSVLIVNKITENKYNQNITSEVKITGNPVKKLEEF